MPLTKAVIINRDAVIPAPIPLMFNPPSYALAKTNQFAEIRIPGLPTAVLQYVSGEATTLSAEFFFDTTGTGIDVRTRTAAISSLLEPDPVTLAPPRLLLLWGSLVFQCVLVSVRQEFEAFNSLGMPLRARLTVEFKGWDEATTLAGPLPLPLLSEAGAYIVKAGQSLAQIAAEQLQDPTRWRAIADANNLDDPRALTAGVRLRIPGLTS
jgi:nucleoid-associated protein YgaU